MSRVITFSRTFPAYHPKAGQPTNFVEKFHQWYWDWFDLPYYSLNEMLHEVNPEMSEDAVDNFVESIEVDDCSFNHKNHTIRSGTRWKAGDKFSPRVWGEDINPKSGKSGPYQSKQITIAPDITIVKTWDFEINDKGIMQVNGGLVDYDYLASNDGLAVRDLMEWFKYPDPFKGQIICWNDSVNY